MRTMTLPHNSHAKEKIPNTLKGKYIEALTAEILACMDDLLSDDLDDSDFLDGQKRIRAIIAREYVDIQSQA